ncbi:uncharacterized protein LOC132637359 [Lycium barbarum]|uniref:uncharacterized protein LOC132637359 n=1 Tax=Lycium barbarum TaxID=112863 RepID=UPI00293EA779|nr:uncharacterized protein LOC132637359 [Lycium barbarum]
MGSLTRPSCARVKVEVDLLKELPKRIHISCIDEETGEVKAKWQKIQYDYLPKYCTQCKLQGHDLQDCWVVHPEYRPKKEEPKLEGGGAPGKPKLKQVNESMKDQPTSKSIATTSETTKSQPAKPVETKGKGANNYGRYNGNNTKMKWNAVTNKKKKQNNMEEGQRGKLAKDNDEENGQQRKENGQQKNNVNSFQALTNEEEENSVEIVAEQRMKKAETSETSKPWVESSFGTSKDGEKMIQTVVESNPKGKTGNKEIQEECSMSNEPVSNKDKQLMQSKTDTDKQAEIPNQDESKRKEINNTQKYAEKENHNEEGPSKTVEEEVNKSGVTEKEQEKVKVMQDVDLNKVPDKPPDESLNRTTEDEGEGTYKESFEDSQSSSVGNEGTTMDQQDAIIPPETQSVEIIEENMTEHTTNNKDDTLNKEEDMQRKNSQLVAKKFEKRGQQQAEDGEEKEIDIGDDDEMDEQNIAKSIQKAMVKGGISPRHFTKNKNENIKKTVRDKSVPPSIARGVQTRKTTSKSKVSQ